MLHLYGRLSAFLPGVGSGVCAGSCGLKTVSVPKTSSHTLQQRFFVVPVPTCPVLIVTAKGSSSKYCRVREEPGQVARLVGAAFVPQKVEGSIPG